jgi:N-acetylglutamate synthase-like GNAT family acetyltransferase
MGVGAKLVAELKRLAESQDLESLWARVGLGDSRAEAWLRKIGFAESQEVFKMNQNSEAISERILVLPIDC